jgi:predicted O-methyltransferase YrrM
MLRIILKYLRFYVKAYSHYGHGIHSPFVYDLLSRVLAPSEDENLNNVLHWRRLVKKDGRHVYGRAPGAGSSAGEKAAIPAGRLASLTGISHACGSILYGLIREFRPETIIELGTGLGISTAYLALACPERKIISIEGSIERSELARQNLLKLGIQNIHFLSGDFETHLATLLSNAKHPLFIFIDGNHKYQPTIEYFETILNFRNENTIIVIDDIYWSAEMEQAWKEISLHRKVMLSIDLFRFGILFFKKGMHKQHYRVKYPGILKG